MSGLAAMKDSAAFCMTGSTVVEPVDDDILGVGGHAQTQGGTGKDQSFGEIHDSAPLKGKKSLLRLDPEAPPFSSGFVTEM